MDPTVGKLFHAASVLDLMTRPEFATARSAAVPELVAAEKAVFVATEDWQRMVALKEQGARAAADLAKLKAEDADLTARMQNSDLGSNFDKLFLAQSGCRAKIAIVEERIGRIDALTEETREKLATAWKSRMQDIHQQSRGQAVQALTAMAPQVMNDIIKAMTAYLTTLAKAQALDDVNCPMRTCNPGGAAAMPSP
jgi:hypothetical protein